MLSTLLLVLSLVVFGQKTALAERYIINESNQHLLDALGDFGKFACFGPFEGEVPPHKTGLLKKRKDGSFKLTVWTKKIKRKVRKKFKKKGCRNKSALSAKEKKQCKKLKRKLKHYRAAKVVCDSKLAEGSNEGDGGDDGSGSDQGGDDPEDGGDDGSDDPPQPPPPPIESTDATYTIRNIGTSDSPAERIYTLSVLSPKNKFTGSNMVAVLDDGTVLPTQVTALATHPQGGALTNGTNLHSLLSFRLGALSPGESLDVTIGSTAFEPAQPFSTDSSLVNSLPFSFDLQEDGGARYTYSFDSNAVTTLLADAEAGNDRCKVIGGAFGPLVRMCEDIFYPTNVVGGAAHNTLQLVVRWMLEKDNPNVRVIFLIENTRMANSNIASIDVDNLTITMGAQTVLDLDDSFIAFHGRIMKEVWSVSTPATLVAHAGVDYANALSEAALLPPLHYESPVPESVSTSIINDIIDSSGRGDLDPNESLGIPSDPGPVYRHQPGTGDRADIGRLPYWSAMYMNGWGKTAWLATRSGDGNGSAGFQVHTRDEATGEMGLAHNNSWWTSDRMIIDNRQGKPNCAHAPHLGGTSYVLEGDKHFLEELCSWATYCLKDRSPEGQIRKYARDEAWTYRDVSYCAAFLPDQHPLKPYMLTQVKDTADRLSNPANYTSGSPLGTFEEGGYEPENGRKGMVTMRRTSEWMSAWFTASVAAASVLHEVAGYDLVEHHWKYYQFWFSGPSVWHSDALGIDIVSDCSNAITCPAFNYDTLSGLFTPQLDGSGGLTAMDNSNAYPVNAAHATYHVRVNEDYKYTAGQAPTSCPGASCDYDDWTPQGNVWSAPDNNDYFEYGPGRAGILYYFELLGMPNVTSISSPVENVIETQYIQKDKPAGTWLRWDIAERP